MKKNLVLIAVLVSGFAMANSHVDRMKELYHGAEEELHDLHKKLMWLYKKEWNALKYSMAEEAAEIERIQKRVTFLLSYREVLRKEIEAMNNNCA